MLLECTMYEVILCKFWINIDLKNRKKIIWKTRNREGIARVQTSTDDRAKGVWKSAWTHSYALTLLKIHFQRTLFSLVCTHKKDKESFFTSFSRFSFIRQVVRSKQHYAYVRWALYAYTTKGTNSPKLLRLQWKKSSKKIQWKCALLSNFSALGCGKVHVCYCLIKSYIDWS